MNSSYDKTILTRTFQKMRMKTSQIKPMRTNMYTLDGRYQL